MLVRSESPGVGDDGINKTGKSPNKKIARIVEASRSRIFRNTSSLLCFLHTSKQTKQIQMGKARGDADEFFSAESYPCDIPLYVDVDDTFSCTRSEDQDSTVSHSTTSEDCTESITTFGSSFFSLVEKYYDVRLISSDLKAVPAVRSLLAAKSPVFRQILKGRSDSSRDSSVLINCPSHIICDIVEYCGTDMISTLEDIYKEHTAKRCVHLFAVGHTFDIPGIKEAAWRKAFEILRNVKSLTCAILEEAIGHEEEVVTSEFVPVAMQVIRMNPRDVLLPKEGACGCGILSLSTAGLAMIIKDDNIYDEEVKVECLEVWASGKTNAQASTFGENINHIKQIENSDDKTRYIVAKALSSHIRLSRIAPSSLQNILIFSSIITESQSLKACKEQGSLVERGFDIRNLLCENNRSTKSPNDGFVVIRNAGIQEVNGIYLFGTNPKKLVYSKEGQWKGENVSFKLFRKAPNWYIGLPEHSTPIIFYFAPINKDNDLIPPSEQWQNGTIDRTECKGVEPLPQSFWMPDT